MERIKLLRRRVKKKGKEYIVYAVFLPRKIIGALGDVKMFDIQLKAIDGEVAIVLIPVKEEKT
ncbi:MAG: hypothetical protein NZ954_08445 [Thermofilaceae archaeon]|nr:hypothetical protein [Thermofilaceae archaeon]MDW8004948.1 hypothetical protein [Thermofilaceae archaeon]